MTDLLGALIRNRLAEKSQEGEQLLGRMNSQPQLDSGAGRGSVQMADPASRSDLIGAFVRDAAGFGPTLRYFATNGLPVKE